MVEPEQFSQSNVFARAVRRVLRPLVRALIAQGVTAPAFYRFVKRTYVSVAEEELGRGATDSRISVITGVHRRDIREFRHQPDQSSDTVGQKVSVLALVVGRWMSDAVYQGESGPMELPRLAEGAPSFEALVRSVSRDVRPRTVLDELVRQNVVALEDDRVRLIELGLTGRADTEQKLHFFSHNLGDHMSASVDNLLNDPSPHLERAVFYNHLTPASVDEIEAEARRLGMDMLRRLNTMAAAHQAQDISTQSASHRFRFGVFFYTEDEDKEGPPADDAP